MKNKDTNKKAKIIALLKKYNSKTKYSKHTALDILLYAIPVVVLIFVIIFVLISSVIPKPESAPVTDELYNSYSNDDTFKNRVYGEKQTPNMENNATPEEEKFAISVYGDSYCIAANVRTPSFPAYLSKYTNSGLVYNIANSNDNLEIMAGREGGLPMYVSACDIPANKKKVEITLENEYGTNIVPDLEKNSGLNPCKINGVEGVISTKNDRLYFTRSESGFENIVATPTYVQTRAMELRLNDITVFFIGSDETYKNGPRTVDIFKRMVNNLKTDKYLIVGPIRGSSTEIINGNKALEAEFGNKYLNLFDYLCNDAISEYKIEIDSEILKTTREQMILPSYYLSEDKNYFNEAANDIIGKKIADKLKELKYIS